MGSLFNKDNRENDEENVHKRAILDKKKKALVNSIFTRLFIIGSIIGFYVQVIFSGGLILLIDGGITIAYIITRLSIAAYEKIVEKYLKNIPISKKRDFKIEMHKFYEKIFNDMGINDNNNCTLKVFVNEFIEHENILEKTDNAFEEKRNNILDDSNKSKEKFNILVICPTGAGKSTLINNFLGINEAKESYGDGGTLEFRSYRTHNSEYNLIDSQGLDYNKTIEGYLNLLKNFVIDSNKDPSTFIDMIYYCTNNNTRLQEQEIILLKELEKQYDLQIVPLIIVHTQAFSESFNEQFKNFVNEKYEWRYPVINILAKDLDDKIAFGLDELKNETRRKKENIFESSYYGKFIANVSKNIYKKYSENAFKTVIKGIKGIFKSSKEDSINNMLKKIFNMYRFEKKDKSFSTEQQSILNEYQTNLILSYNNHIDDFIRIVIKYSAQSDAYYEKSQNLITQEEIEERVEELYNEKQSNEFNDFKNDIDTLIFPCLIDIF